MAYGVNYRAGFASPSNRVGYLYIDKDGYSGAVTDIKLAANGLKLSHVWESWDSPIVGLRLEFDIVNDKTDFFELLPLLSAEEKEYKIRVVINSPGTPYTLFEGYLNCDTITQKYLHKQIIRFAASSYLSKLDNIHPVSIDTLQNKIFINLIDEILVSTGASYPIRVNCKLHAEGDNVLSEQSLFNFNGFYTELFWIDNIERTTALEILKTILISFNCYIYWNRGYWYIERYEDIYEETIEYTEYTSGVTYTPVDFASHATIYKVITDLHTLKFIEQSQTQSVIPGMKTIQVNLQDKRLNNLVNGDLLGMVPIVATPPAPTYRTWQYTTATGFWILLWGKTFGILANSVYRTIMPTFVFDIESGIFTSIKLTVIDVTTAINVTFKFVSDFSSDPSVLDTYKFSFHWNLRKAGTSDYVCQSSEDTNDWNLYPAGAGDRIQIVTVEGSSFDKKNGSVEVSFTIPIGLVDVISSGADAGKLIGDQEFILGLLIETYKINDSTTDYHLQYAWIGDIVVTSTGTLQDNVIKGKNDNAKFLNKKEIGVDLYDGLGFDYKNSILRGASMEYRTERWGTGGSSANIIARGVCWGVSANPVIAMDHTVDGTGSGTFVSYLTGLTLNQLYHIRAYMTDADGNTTYGAVETFTTRVLAVGDSYRGGKVAYIYQAGDPGYDADVQHGIIAALSDQYTNEHAVNGRIFWGSLSPARTEGPQAWGFALGDGITNSGLIAAGAVQYSEYANKVCLDYVVGAYDHWYFPSIVELSKLFLNRVAIGGFTTDFYWSSTEGSPGTDWTDNGSIIHDGENRFAWCINFWGGAIPPYFPVYMYRKNNWMRVRPIQYF